MRKSARRLNELIDTSTIHYNPAGPGDYNLPSSFGELPKPRSKAPKTNRAGSVIKTKPSFSLGNRIEDTRVFTNNLDALYSKDSPPLGVYDPVNPSKNSFEDKAKLNLIRANRATMQE